MPTTPAGCRPAAGREMAGAAAMVRLKETEVAVSGVAVPESVALKTRPLVVPTQEATGVPEMTPAEFIVRQDGSVPLVIVHVYGEIPPDAASNCE